MWCPVSALIPQGDRSVMNWVIDQLVNEIYWIMQAAGLGVSLRGMGQIYEPGRTFRRVAGALAVHPAPFPLLDSHPGPRDLEDSTSEGCMFQVLAGGQLGPL